MTQTTLHNESPCILYQTFVNTSLERSSVSMKYTVFQELSLADVKILKLPSAVHRQVLNLHCLDTNTSAEHYLSLLDSLTVHAEHDRESYMLFYMLNYVLLYIQLYDSNMRDLFNKLYALVLCCFDYNCLREDTF